MHKYLFAIVTLAVTVGAGMPAAANTGTPPSVADFFRYPAIVGASLSPSGRHVAVVGKGGSDGRYILAIVDARDPSKWTGVAAFKDADITTVYWVNDDRLVFQILDLKETKADENDSGLYTVDREAKTPPKVLIRRTYNSADNETNFKKRLFGESGLSARYRFHSVLRDGGDDIVVTKLELDARGISTGTNLFRLNTVTSETRRISNGAPDSVHHWSVDRQGMPRAGVSQRDGKSRLHWRATVDGPWMQVAEWPSMSDERRALTTLHVDGNNTLYANAYADTSADNSMLATIDMSRPRVELKALLDVKGYDYNGSLVLRADDGALLGIHYLADARGTHWLDAGLRGLQAKVDAALPGTINFVDCGGCRVPKVLLVSAFADRVPLSLYLFDVASSKLVRIAQAYPGLKPEAMARREMQRVKTRDGLAIPVHVTRPAGLPGPRPAVILVHGDLLSRGGEWRWYPESQFLASRGYVVIEPEYRGSTGFGITHQNAGRKQWGLAIQDDIADALQWAVAQGLVDKDRVCIMGATFGGYAALMGLVRHDSLYRCAVSWSGVADLESLYMLNAPPYLAIWQENYLPALIGEPGKDREQFNKTSPLRQAAAITKPVLLAHGERDYLVPIAHAESLRKAILQHNKQLEWIEYPGEGRNWKLEATHIDFWTRVEKFLGANLRMSK